MINVELHVVGGKHAGQVIRLNRKKFLIGRESDCQLRPNSELVSRHHCIFTVDDYSVRLRDLGSTNGTVVNGERLKKEVVLNQGDLVTVGSLEFRVVVQQSEAQGGSDISAVSEETVVSGVDTLAEMPAVETPNSEMPAPESQPESPDSAASTASTAEPPASGGSDSQQMPAQPPVPPELAAPGNSGDTTVIAQPMMMPGQQPYQPMMQPPMGYPQMYGGYPYPQMPMYPQQFPGGMPGYPQQHPQQLPPAAAPAQPADAGAAPGEATTADGMNISLPDPSETGAKAPEPPKPAANQEGGDSAEVASNQSAAAIIQQHRQRKPGG